MVEETTAWRDSAGKLHASKLDAAKADARLQLQALVKNDALVNTMMEHAALVHAALEPYVHEAALEGYPAPTHHFGDEQIVDLERYPSTSPASHQTKEA